MAVKLLPLLFFCFLCHGKVDILHPVWLQEKNKPHFCFTFLMLPHSRKHSSFVDRADRGEPAHITLSLVPTSGFSPSAAMRLALPLFPVKSGTRSLSFHYRNFPLFSPEEPEKGGVAQTGGGGQRTRAFIC